MAENAAEEVRERIYYNTRLMLACISPWSLCWAATWPSRLITGYLIRSLPRVPWFSSVWWAWWAIWP